MKLLLNLIVLMKNPTRTVPLSCSYLGIISHYGPQICQKREVIIVTNLYLWLAPGILRILLTYLCFQIILILLVVVSVAEEFKVWCIWVSENKRFLAFVVKLNIGHCLCWMHFSNLLTFGGNCLWIPLQWVIHLFFWYLNNMKSCLFQANANEVAITSWKLMV